MVASVRLGEKQLYSLALAPERKVVTRDVHVTALCESQVNPTLGTSLVPSSSLLHRGLHAVTV